MGTNNKLGSGCGATLKLLALLLQIIFLTLKVSGNFLYSWWWVFSPAIGFIGIIILFLLTWIVLEWIDTKL